MKVVVQLTITNIDLDEWALDYGLDDRRAAERDVQASAGSIVQQWLHEHGYGTAVVGTLPG